MNGFSGGRPLAVDPAGWLSFVWGVSEKKPATIAVMVVEDDDEIRGMLCRVIERSPGLRLAGEYRTGEDATAALKQCAPEVVVMDIQLPGMSGIECTRAVREAAPETQVLVFTVFGDSDHVFEALKAGASGYLLKRTSREEIVEAIELVRDGGAPMSGGIARLVVESFRKPAKGGRNPACECLSPREEEILGLLAKGYLAKEIADQLSISFFTVRFHIRKIYEKLHVRSKTEAILKYLG
jgi:DNA-binding NarL/FixJ family response regulator